MNIPDLSNIYTLFKWFFDFILQFYEAIREFLTYSFTIPLVDYEVTILSIATVALPVFLVAVLLDKIPVI